jgi:hypothetical protein
VLDDCRRVTPRRISAPTRMSTTWMVRKASNAWALDIGAPAALTFFFLQRPSQQEGQGCDENVRPNPVGPVMVDGASR